MSEAVSAIGGSKGKASDMIASYRRAKMQHAVPKNKLGSSAQFIAATQQCPGGIFTHPTVS